MTKKKKIDDDLAPVVVLKTDRLYVLHALRFMH